MILLSISEGVIAERRARLQPGYRWATGALHIRSQRLTTGGFLDPYRYAAFGAAHQSPSEGDILVRNLTEEHDNS